MDNLYCHKCRTSLIEGSQFCPSCGTKIELKNSPTSVQNVPIEESTKPMVAVIKEKKSNVIWLLPAFTALFAVIVIVGFYFHETSISRDVEVLVQLAEKKALEGDLQTAKESIEQALLNRPNHTIAAINLTIIQNGELYEGLLKEALSHSDANQYDEAFILLNQIDEQLTDYHGPFYDRFKEQSGILTTSITLASVRDSQEDLQSIDELANLLEKIEAFTSEESQELIALLKRRIVDIAVNNAQNHLQKNQFSEADAEIEHGLKFDESSDKLLAYKETVRDEKTAFEEAEINRLEQAMAKVAQEDVHNRTNSAELLLIDFSYDDDYSDFYVWGEVKNRGTRPISTIEINYSMYDLEDQFIDSSSTYVFPNQLMPNETGSFEETLVIYDTVGRVEIDTYNWNVK